LNKNANVAVAVVGCGYWGKNLVRNFSELGALCAVCDEQASAAADIGKTFSVPAMSFEAILDDESIDAVVLATPAVTHADLARAALRKGKHVFSEKPLAIDLADATSVVETAQEEGRILMVGHLLQYHPAFLMLKDMVSSGDLGVLRYIYSNRLNFGKIRSEENILWSFAPHDISMILSLAGCEPDTIQAIGSQYLQPNVADVTTTHLTFPNGIRGHIFVSWLHPFKEQKLVVIGDKAMAVFDDGAPWEEKITFYRHHVEEAGGAFGSVKADGEFIPLEPSEPLKLECSHFLDCIAQGIQPRTDGEEALRVLRVLQTAQQQI